MVSMVVNGRYLSKGETSMNNNELTAYHEIVTWGWKYFKKYCLNYDADAALQELRDFVDRYEKGSMLREFAFRTAKVAWDEFGRIHERESNEKNQNKP